MSDLSSPIYNFARFVGIVFPTLYAGVTCQCWAISDSFTFVQPIIEHAPTQKVMAKQWLRGYQYGPLWVPPLIIPGTISNVYLALQSTTSTQRYLYAFAALAIFSIAPITFFYMEPGINGACKWKAQSLLRDEGMALPETSVFMPSAHKHGSTHSSRRWAERTSMRELILYWRFVNNFRWVIGGLAAVASGWATFSSV